MRRFKLSQTRRFRTSHPQAAFWTNQVRKSSLIPSYFNRKTRPLRMVAQPVVSCPRPCQCVTACLSAPPPGRRYSCRLDRRAISAECQGHAILRRSDDAAPGDASRRERQLVGNVTAARFIKSSARFRTRFSTRRPSSSGRFRSNGSASLEQLAGLPPALVIVDENDVLRDEGEAYARRLIQAGVPTTSVRYNAIIHDFMMLNPVRATKAATAAIEQAIQVLRKALGT